MSFKKTSLIAAVALSLFSGAAAAQWNVSGGYLNLSSDSDDGLDVSLSAVTAGLGYTFYGDSSKSWSVMPELRAGVGLGDDTADDFSPSVDIELSRFLSASVRASYYLDDTVSIYVQPGYTNIELEANAFGQSYSEDEWEFGVGAGLNAQISENFSIEAQYERYSDANVLSASIRYAF